MDLRQYRFGKVASPLLAFARNVTSQSGEDGIIERIVELIKPEHEFCVEFGAWDGRLYSNCHTLIVDRGWRGLMIEGNAAKFRELVETFRDNGRVQTANRFVDFQPPDDLDTILSDRRTPENFGLLSIDIDGNDFHVWTSLKRHAPEIVVIEFNPTIPNDVYFVQDKSFKVNQGCSLLAVTMLAKDKGYELAVCTKWNAFFVRKDKFGRLGIENNSIQALYQPVQDGRIFHGFDGTVYVIGMDRLLWHDIPVSSENFQVLPKEARVLRGALKR